MGLTEEVWGQPSEEDFNLAKFDTVEQAST